MVACLRMSPHYRGLLVFTLVLAPPPRIRTGGLYSAAIVLIVLA